MDDLTYEEQLEQDLKDARTRAVNGIVAGHFLKTPEGQLIQEWINERVSFLIDKITGKKPVDEREYLAAQGAISELKDFNVMLQSKAMTGKIAEQEVKALDEQQRSLREVAP